VTLKSDQRTTPKLCSPQRGPEPDREVVVPAEVLERLRAERKAAERDRLSAAGSILEVSR
jgi:hypothetical protein